MKQFLLILQCFIISQSLYGQVENEQQKTSELQIRDPFVLVSKQDSLYYMYASTSQSTDTKEGRSGVIVYKSNDLKLWSKPQIVMVLPEDTWADPQHGVWAPEVHLYKGKYYLFCTLTSKKELPTPNGRPQNILRGTQIFVSDSPLGPFVPTAHPFPCTPLDWMSLDGTFYVEDGKPYMIFCHEWTQVEDGTFEMQELKEDLNGIIGEPKELFKASDAPWTRSGVNYKGTLFSGRVTDGPFFYKTKTNKLITLWSSFDKSGYCLAYAVSDSGKLEGPWSHPKKPLLDKGHGHGCLFNCLDGQLMLVCHSPNNTPLARATFFEVKDLGKGLKILDKMKVF